MVQGQSSTRSSSRRKAGVNTDPEPKRKRNTSSSSTPKKLNTGTSVVITPPIKNTPNQNATVRDRGIDDDAMSVDTAEEDNRNPSTVSSAFFSFLSFRFKVKKQ